MKRRDHDREVLRLRTAHAAQLARLRAIIQTHEATIAALRQQVQDANARAVQAEETWWEGGES